MRGHALLLLLLAACHGADPSQEATQAKQGAPRARTACASPVACIARLQDKDVAGDPHALQHVARELVRLGDPGWDALVVAATGDDEELRDAAGRVMEFWPPIDDRKVAGVAAALEREPGGWPARALMHSPSEAATKVLIDDLRRAGGENQSSHVLAMRLPRAFDAVIRSAVAADSLKLSAAVGGELLMLSRNAVEDASAAQRQQRIGEWLLDAAGDSRNSVPYRREATAYLLDLGRLDGLDFSRLQANLSARDERLAWATRRFLIQQGDASMLPTVLAACGRMVAGKDGSNPDGSFAPNVFETCTDPLARMGTAARSAIPKLESWLEISDFDSRSMLIATIGYVGDVSNARLLEMQLSSTDERNVTASLESLWRLGAKTSIPAIRRVATSHWHDSVREFATRVADALQSGRPEAVEEALRRDFREDSPTSRHVWGLPLERNKQRPWCVAWSVGGRVVDERQRIKSDHALAKTHGVSQPGISATHALGDGLLFGIDQGEFGGGLVHRDQAGRTQRLSGANTVAIVPHRNGALAFTGLAHMMDTGGSMLRIETGRPAARIVERRYLPSAPVAVYRIDGGWLVDTASHLGIVIREDLSFSEATCSKSA